MTTEDILRMANHCRFRIDAEDFVMPREGNYALRLARFALLVRDHMISEGWRQCAQGQKTSQFCGMVERARAEEREAAVLAAGSTLQAHGVDWQITEQVIRNIRARSSAAQEENPSF